MLRSAGALADDFAEFETGQARKGGVHPQHDSSAVHNGDGRVGVHRKPGENTTEL